jgi:hypothetical protein
LAGARPVGTAREITAPTNPAATAKAAAASVNIAWSRLTNILFTIPKTPSALFICEVIAILGSSQKTMKIGLI